MIYIVSVTFNDAKNLRRTLESVRRFKKSYQRCVVIDGGSRDGTLALLHEFADIIDFSLSEPDRGIYDAMNKSLRIPGLRDDDYLIWINGGDELIEWPEALPQEIAKFDCAFCGVNLGVAGGNLPHFEKVDIRLPYDERTFSPISKFWHQGFFIRVDKFRTEPYDITVGIQAENLMMSRAIRGLRWQVFQLPVANFYAGGISSRYFPLFVSWIKAARKLDFSMWRVAWYQRVFILKQLIKMFLPSEFVYRYTLKRCELRGRVK